MRKESQHPSLVRLLNNVVSEIPITKKGTYNLQDPTAFVKGENTYLYKGKHFRVEFNDCTWGIEITISRVLYMNYAACYHRGRAKEIAGFYISRDSKYNRITDRWEGYDNIIYRQKGSKGIIKLLMKLFPQCISLNFRTKDQIAWDWEERQMWLNKEEGVNIWVDPAGGVHYGNEEDPASMYE